MKDSMAASDPLGFIDSLRIPSAHGVRRFGDVMAGFQRADFQALAPSLCAVRAGGKPSPSRFWLERTKGGSKDSDLACCLLWLLAYCPRPLTVQVGAADQSQADELRKAAKAILRLNPSLGKLLTIQSLAIINPHTDSRCDIIPADTMGSHGARPDVLVLNELTHVANREFCETLLDNASKMPNGVVIIASNAGHDPSWQLEWRQTAIESNRWHFSAFAEPAPWLDADELAEARRRNSPNRYARLWQGQWVSETGGAIAGEMVDAAVDETLSELTGPEPGYEYCLGCDLSLTKDHSALVLLGRFVGEIKEVTQRRKYPLGGPLEIARQEGFIDADDPNVRTIIRHLRGDGSYRLALVRSWRPPAGGKIDLGLIEATIRKVCRRFGAYAVLDQWQAASISERLHREQIRNELLYYSPTVLHQMAEVIIGGFSSPGTFRLYPHQQLIDQLKTLRCEERPSGTKLTSPRGRGGHGDLASALTLAAWGLSRDSEAIGDYCDPELTMVYPDEQ
jgi:hypothetical protein